MPRSPEAILERQLGIEFKDRALLKLALTHRSYVHEAPADAPESNERLEYLGDAFLGFVVAEHLYGRFPDLPEGRLTALRSGLVRSATLAAVAAELDLGRRLYLGHGEETSGGRTRERNLARGFEAVLGAVLLDQGYFKAKRWTLKLFKDRLESLPPGLVDDFKSLLQEAVQAEDSPPPVYRTVREEGPDHDRDFTVEVIVDGAVAGEGSGPSKQKAEREAARAALANLGLS